MAFTVQLPNNCKLKHINWTSKAFLRDIHGWMNSSKARSKHNVMSAKSAYSFAQKVGNISPSLCFQVDVFYPNAIAAVCNTVTERFDNTRENGGPHATGCRGNQVQRDFPLEARLPIMIPLVQYPSPASDTFIDELDMCASPVLNWEKYVETIKNTVSRRRFKERARPRIQPLSDKDRVAKKKDRWKRKCKGLPIKDRPKLEDVATSSSDESDAYIKSSSEDEDDPTWTNEKVITKAAKRRKRRKTLEHLKIKLFQRKLHLTKKKVQKATSSPDIDNVVKLGYLKKLKTQYRANFVKCQLDGIKNIPELRLQSTWNYLYGGSSGACCTAPKNEQLRVFVGNRRQIRQIILEKSSPSAMVSYKVQSVWEEDISNVPSNVKPENCYVDPLSDTVFQISLPRGKFNILGVRRGRSVDLYDIEEDCPYLLDSIPNICYGTYKYSGLKLKNQRECVQDPLILGMDFNASYSSELITIDENLQLRICDFSKGETISCYSINKRNRPTKAWPDYPKFNYINDAAGVRFGHHGHLFYAWYDSKVLLGDRRENIRARAKLMEIFDLRRSTSSISWSDQVFYNQSQIELAEYTSSLTLSKKENYYYLGTTTRVFLMDARVPGQPVLKLEHGLTTAAYMDTCTDDSFETLVCTSQRLGNSFACITDHAHVKCFDRPECQASNPVLHCLPRHLSNSREFFDTSLSSGCSLDWEAEHLRAKRHNYAWTSGMALHKVDGPLKDPHGPPGILLFTSNAYGDAFCQEWEQIPIENSRKTKVGDYKFTSFLNDWKSSMQSVSKLDFGKPSLNFTGSIDYSLMIDASAKGIQSLDRVRMDVFDAMKPNELVFRDIQQHQTPFSTRVSQLRKYKADIAQRCLDFWEHSSDVQKDAAAIKQERLDQEFDAMYENEWNEDGTRDVEYLFAGLKTQELVDLPRTSQGEQHNVQLQGKKMSLPTSATASQSDSDISNSDTDTDADDGGISQKQVGKDSHETQLPTCSNNALQKASSHEELNPYDYSGDEFESSHHGKQRNEMGEDEYESQYIPLSQPISSKKRTSVRKSRAGF